MENKLQELTQRLYDEGLSKGRKEADVLLAAARNEAKSIIEEAKSEADRIKRNAQNDAEDLHKNTLTELNLAGKQMIGKLKTSIQEMLVTRSTEDPVAKLSLDPGFVSNMLLTVAGNWKGSSGEKIALSALLPQQMKDELDRSFGESIKKIMDAGVEIAYSNGLKSGFHIGPKDGRYYISFTDASFHALLGEYLGPKTSEVLYGTKA